MPLWSSIRKLLRSDKVSVYLALGDLNYTRAAGILESAGIPFYVKFGNGMNNEVSGYDNRLSEYEIYVKREYEKKARMALGTY